MTTKHRTIYTTSTLLPRIRSVLTFRNLYAQQPFLVPALVDSNQCYVSLFNFINLFLYHFSFLSNQQVQLHMFVGLQKFHFQLFRMMIQLKHGHGHPYVVEHELIFLNVDKLYI
jgi:hypothetical protein